MARRPTGRRICRDRTMTAGPVAVFGRSSRHAGGCAFDADTKAAENLAVLPAPPVHVERIVAIVTLSRPLLCGLLVVAVLVSSLHGQGDAPKPIWFEGARVIVGD